MHLRDKNRKKEKLQTLDSSYFFGKSQFQDDGTQNYSVYQPAFNYFKTPTNSYSYTVDIKVLLEVSIKPPATSDNSLNPGINYIDNAKIHLKFD